MCCVPKDSCRPRCRSSWAAAAPPTPRPPQILTELAKGCPATAVTLSMHYHLLATQLWRHRHGLTGEAVLRKVAADNVLLVSTGASDWLDSSGIATRVEGGYRVSGRKAPASGAPAGGIAVDELRLARRSRRPPGHPLLGPVQQPTASPSS